MGNWYSRSICLGSHGLQRRLRKLLERMAEPFGFLVDAEYPYRPFPENEVWGGDVACVSGPRYRVKKWLEGFSGAGNQGDLAFKYQAGTP